MVEDEDDFEDRPVDRWCGRCGVRAPRTSTAHTLIGKEHGWRVFRASAEISPRHFEWRCPACWKAEPPQ